jgi:hypothetical protein
MGATTINTERLIGVWENNIIYIQERIGYQENHPNTNKPFCQADVDWEYTKIEKAKAKLKYWEEHGNPHDLTHK